MTPFSSSFPFSVLSLCAQDTITRHDCKHFRKLFGESDESVLLPAAQPVQEQGGTGDGFAVRAG